MGSYIFHVCLLWCFVFSEGLTSFAPASNKQLRVAVKVWQRDNPLAHFEYGDISMWDVSSITNMSNLFYKAASFQENISQWNTASVTDMSYMFYGAEAFDSDISQWNTAQVTNMSGMFMYAKSFNGDISQWNTASVTDMSYMFSGSKAFNGDISRWDTSSATDMQCMFVRASAFQANISQWNTSAVTNMYEMFREASSFNADISEWDVSSVTDMSSMFLGASRFSHDLGKSWMPFSLANEEGFPMFCCDAPSFTKQSWSSWRVQPACEGKCFLAASAPSATAVSAKATNLHNKSAKFAHEASLVLLAASVTSFLVFGLFFRKGSGQGSSDQYEPLLTSSAATSTLHSEGAVAVPQLEGFSEIQPRPNMETSKPGAVVTSPAEVGAILLKTAERRAAATCPPDLGAVRSEPPRAGNVPTTFIAEKGGVVQLEPNREQLKRLLFDAAPEKLEGYLALCGAKGRLHFVRQGFAYVQWRDSQGFIPVRALKAADDENAPALRADALGTDLEWMQPTLGLQSVERSLISTRGQPPTKFEQDKAASVLSLSCVGIDDVEENGWTVEEGVGIGEGGFGEVKLGTLTGDGERLEVAIKTLKKSGTRDFQSEVEALRDYAEFGEDVHEYMVRLVAISMQKRWIITEYCKYGSLKDWMGSASCTNTPDSLRLRLTFLQQIAAALAWLADKGVVHCDVKLGNVFVTADTSNSSQKAKLGDFGLAHKPSRCRGRTAGTRLYMAPELLDGKQDGSKCAGCLHSEKSDVWSLALTAYALIRGKEIDAACFWNGSGQPIARPDVSVEAMCQTCVLSCLQEDFRKRLATLLSAALTLSLSRSISKRPTCENLSGQFLQMRHELRAF